MMGMITVPLVGLSQSELAMGKNILVVCSAGAVTLVAEETNEGMTVSGTEDSSTEGSPSSAWLTKSLLGFILMLL